MSFMNNAAIALGLGLGAALRDYMYRRFAGFWERVLPNGTLKRVLLFKITKN